MVQIGRFRAPVIPGLLDPVMERLDAQPVKVRKNVRKVSKETYNVLADTGLLGAATTKVMRALKHCINTTQTPPTPEELALWMFQHGVIPRARVQVVAPRLTELHIGKFVRRKGQEPLRVGGGEVEKLPLRVCRVTGNMAHPVRPREKGSVLR